MHEDCWYKKVCTKKCTSTCLRYTEMSYLMENSGVPKKKQIPTTLTAGVDIKAFQKLANIKDNIEDFVSSGENLYICSKEVGNGKTSWAIKLLLKYFDCVWAGNGLRIRGYFVHTPSLFTLLKDFGNDEIARVKQILFNANLVVWDDIASTKLSDYDITQLLMFIDQRTLYELSNIYTGNITTKDQLAKCVGNKLASRIWNYSTIIEFVGKDKRNGSVADNQ